MRHLGRLPTATLIALFSLATPAFAQSEAPVGVRAAGMGGAFTAVADDASAAFWNPAGFASGSFFSAVVDANTLDRRSAQLVAFGMPALGLSYYRTAIAEVATGRNTLVAHQIGVTLVQSIGERFAVGSTLKLVHGVASPPGVSRVSGNAFDADIGVMATGTASRFGLTVRNLTEPAFGASDQRVRLQRQVRAGASYSRSRSLLLAADADLTTASTPRGHWRDAAVGLEVNPVENAWFRGGFHWNTASAAGMGAAPIATAGASYAVYGSTLVDAQISMGSAKGDRGWGVGLRFVF